MQYLDYKGLEHYHSLLLGLFDTQDHKNFKTKRAEALKGESDVIYFTPDSKQIIINGLVYGGEPQAVLNPQYNKDIKVITVTLNDLNTRLLDTSDDLNAKLLDISNNLNFLPLTGGTMSGDITMPGETKLIFGETSVYNNGHLFIDGALQVESEVTANGFSHALHTSDDYVLLAGGGAKLLSEIKPDMSGYLPLTGGTLTGDLFIGEGTTALLGTSQGQVILYNDTRLDFTGSGTTTMGPTETGFVISNDGELKLTGDSICVNAADLLEICADGIALNNVSINSSSEIVFDDNGTKLTQEELNFAYDCGIIKMEEDDVMRIYGEGGIRLDSPMTCISNISAAAFYETSDARKKDIKEDLSLDKCYDLIDKCQTVIYSLKDQTKEQVGMIAQEIEEFFPEVVATDEEGFKSLAYDRLVVICFKVLKDVIKRLEKLENNGSN